MMSNGPEGHGTRCSITQSTLISFEQELEGCGDRFRHGKARLTGRSHVWATTKVLKREGSGEYPVR